MIEPNDFLSFCNDVFIENYIKKNKETKNLLNPDSDVNLNFL